METKIKNFSHPSGEDIRVVYREGGPFIVLKDVLTALGYKNTHPSARVKWVDYTKVIPSNIDGRLCLLISPLNLLKAIKSRIGPTERRRYFLKWYTENLLPNIDDTNSSKQIDSLEDKRKEGEEGKAGKDDIVDEAYTLAKAINEVLLALIDIALEHAERYKNEQIPMGRSKG